MSALVELVCVHPSQVGEVWPLVKERLYAAVYRTDMNHSSDLERLAFGEGQLWVAIDGGLIAAVAITVLERTDRHIVCTIAALGGAERGKWLPLLDKIEEWAKAEGAAVIRVIGRKAWGRVLKDYRVSNVVLERAL